MNSGLKIYQSNVKITLILAVGGSEASRNQQVVLEIIHCNCHPATVVDRSHSNGIVSGVGS